MRVLTVKLALGSFEQIYTVVSTAAVLSRALLDGRTWLRGVVVGGKRAAHEGATIRRLFMWRRLILYMSRRSETDAII